MKRKSAAEFKPVKMEERPELPPIEETFENAKQAFVNTLEVSITLAKRVDNLLNIRDYASSFWKGSTFLDGMISADRMDYFKSLQDLSVAVYEALLDRTKQFELEEFLKEEMPDDYEDTIPNISVIETEHELCSAGLVFLTVKPFGEKMTALHHTLLDEQAQRKFEEQG